MKLSPILAGISCRALAIMLLGATGLLSMAGASAQIRPALTLSVDDPGRAPYQASVEQFCFSVNRICDFTFAAVPAGKRLVVQHASGYFSSGQNAQYVFVSLRRLNKNVFFLPTNYQGCGTDIACPNSLYVFNQAMQAVFGEGDTPVIRISKGTPDYPIMNGINPALPLFNTVTLAGYLIDCALAPCQAIAP